MTIYLNTVTGEYPRHDGDLEKLGWVVGDPLPENWVEVIYTEPPTVIFNEQTAIQLEPKQIKGVWKITWGVRDLTDEEKAQLNQEDDS